MAGVDTTYTKGIVQLAMTKFQTIAATNVKILRQFTPISTKIRISQNISLNPSKAILVKH
jgi:hypothetical protein